MALPTREAFLAEVDQRFRALVPAAPLHLDPANPDHASMIQQWQQAHHEVLSRLTDEAFFASYPSAPAALDISDPSQAQLIELWNDIAETISTGHRQKYDWSAATPAAADDAAIAEEQPEVPPQDGSVRFEQSLEQVKVLLDAYVRAVAFTPMATAMITHVLEQIEVLRGLVRDGTFTHFDHWWRSPSYGETLYDSDDGQTELAFVRDITLEAKIDRRDGTLDMFLAGWATDFRQGTSFGRTSRSGA